METDNLEKKNIESEKIDILDFNKKVGFIMIPNVLFSNLTKLNITPYEYLLLSALYYFAHRNDSAWPSRKTLEKLTGISQRNIIYLFNSLIKKGYITKNCRRNKEKGDISNLYSFKPLNIILERIMTNDLIESQKNNTPVQEMHPPCAQVALPPVQEMHPKNTYIEEYIIKNSKLEKEKDTIAPNDFSNEKSNSEQAPKINFNFKSLTWENITEKDTAIWEEAYPAVDIKQELLKIKAWLVSNPEKKKKNYKRFINNWLVKVQDKGGNKKNTTEIEESGKYKNIKTTHIDNVTGKMWVTGG